MNGGVIVATVQLKRASKGHFICKQCSNEAPNEQKTVRNKLSMCSNCSTKFDKDKLEEQEFIRYLITELEIEQISGMILSQIKKFKTELNYPYLGMQYTTWYCKNVINMDFDLKYGIGFIPYKYTEAKDYYVEQERLKNSVPDNIEIKKKVVSRSNKNKRVTKGLYDLSIFGG